MFRGRLVIFKKIKNQITGTKRRWLRNGVFMFFFLSKLNNLIIYWLKINKTILHGCSGLPIMFFFFYVKLTWAFLYFNKSLIFFLRKIFLTHVMHVPTGRHFSCFNSGACGAIQLPNAAILSSIWKVSVSIPWLKVRALNTHPVCS